MPSFLFISKIAGLPLHALVVHVVVVLVPLAAGAFLVTAWNAKWRASYALPIALLAIGGAIGAYLATESGQVLEDSIRPRLGAPARAPT